MKRDPKETATAILGSAMSTSQGSPEPSTSGDADAEPTSDDAALDAITDDFVSGDRASVRAALKALLELARS